MYDVRMNATAAAAAASVCCCCCYYYLLNASCKGAYKLETTLFGYSNDFVLFFSLF